MYRFGLSADDILLCALLRERIGCNVANRLDEYDINQIRTASLVYGVVAYVVYPLEV